ncbi:AAA family ATPase (plasmid) [Embleya sp. NBC_00888]|uniref:ATP/GTP-binding protein n=1 Tax=Embleya sp. NBC_00888 TaxID=2975960 RepID=UPI002F917023|nr:AAA family ATPase [Embleya sp. NBC_00888]
MKRYILTGTPGAGKTTVLRRLEEMGYAVVEEAATDVIARGQARGEPEPWTGETFIDRVVALQRERERETAVPSADRAEDPTADRTAGVRIFDRSPICTHALSVYLNRPVSAALSAELDRVARAGSYRREVFFLRNLGFCEPTAARRIDFEESLRFERVHEESYRAFGYEPIDIAAADPNERAALISRTIRRLTR